MWEEQGRGGLQGTAAVTVTRRYRWRSWVEWLWRQKMPILVYRILLLRSMTSASPPAAMNECSYAIGCLLHTCIEERCFTQWRKA